MNLEFNIENCYGIQKLNYSINFSSNTAIIYASNGAMKSSFANLFEDIINQRNSTDRYFPHRVSRRTIQADGKDLLPEEVLVIPPFANLENEVAISRLLVNDELKKRYEKILKEISQPKESLLKGLQNLSGVKKAANEDEIVASFRKPNKNFYELMIDLESEVHKEHLKSRSEIQYKEISSPKLNSLLESPKFKENLEQYINIYEDLVARTNFFKHGFDHDNADAVLKSLSSNGFFGASHAVKLNSAERTVDVSSEESLKEIFEAERNSVIENEELAKAFKPIDELFSTIDQKKFRTFLLQNKQIVSELKSPSEFKKKLWISYLQKERVAFDAMLAKYREFKDDLEGIIASARDEAPKWKAIIEEFQHRFNPPFRVSIENQHDVILKMETPIISFSFIDANGETVPISNQSWSDWLSTGERRALYLLNVVFEIERKKLEQERILIVADDIADSFDYRNKFAIIQYLLDNHKNPKVKSIILTHNFDFYRTLSTRLYDGDPVLLLATKHPDKICLRKYDDLDKDPFKELKRRIIKKVGDPAESYLPLIPFARNLIEFGKSTKELNYELLTKMMHVKSDSHTLTAAELAPILKENINLTIEPKSSNTIQDDLILIADKYASQAAELDLGQKITLSLSIRILAEKFMVAKLNMSADELDDMRNPTATLTGLYKKNFGNTDAASILDRVCLMTPENIHINSFMYEPIMDLSSWHLKQLYKDAKAL